MRPQTNTPKLNKQDTLLFLSTKGYTPLEQPDNHSFEKKTQEYILNDYENIVDSFVSIIGIPHKFVTLENLNERLINIMDILNPKILKTILIDIQSYRFVESTGYGTLPTKASYTPAQAIFISIYGHLQAMQVYELKNDEKIPLINLEEDLCKEPI